MSRVDNFHTRTLPAHARLRGWQERLRRTFGDVRATHVAESAFDAWTETLSDRGVLVGRVGACAHQLELGSRRRDEGREDLIHVIFPLSGRFQLEQFGRLTVLEPGDWGFFVVTEAFRHRHETAAEMLVLDAPRCALFADGGIERFSARRFSCEYGSAQLAKRYVESLITQRASLHPMTASELVATAVRLVRLSLIENLGARTEIGTQEMLKVRILDYIDRNLQNPELCVDTVARAHHCSKRYVHKVFSAGGETLSHYILRARLERCRDDLRRPALAHLSVTQIAFSWGFNNPGHFSRVFRRRFGVRPSDCRRSARATGPRPRLAGRTPPRSLPENY
jgi:AraC-like DNA-binding protein